MKKHLWNSILKKELIMIGIYNIEHSEKIDEFFKNDMIEINTNNNVKVLKRTR